MNCTKIAATTYHSASFTNKRVLDLHLRLLLKIENRENDESRSPKH